MAASRSLSFTRSSFSPRMRVVPDAVAAITARIGYSSIMLGACSHGTSTPRSAPYVDDQVADRLAALHPAVLGDDVGAHLGEHGEQAAAQLVQPDALDGQPRAGDQQRRGGQEGRGRGIARHGDVGGATVPAGLAA